MTGEKIKLWAGKLLLLLYIYVIIIIVGLCLLAMVTIFSKINIHHTQTACLRFALMRGWSSRENRLFFFPLKFFGETRLKLGFEASWG